MNLLLIWGFIYPQKIILPKRFPLKRKRKWEKLIELDWWKHRKKKGKILIFIVLDNLYRRQWYYWHYIFNIWIFIPFNVSPIGYIHWFLSLLIEKRDDISLWFFVFNNLNMNSFWWILNLKFSIWSLL